MIIDKFDEEYKFLSNSYPASVFCEDGLVYKSSEAAYQAHKTDNIEERKRFQELSPYDAKVLGRKVKTIEHWDNVKYIVMYDIVERKFHQHPDLAEKLLNTGDAELIEGNAWGDTYWGVCNGEGKNILGNMLMDIRESLK